MFSFSLFSQILHVALCLVCICTQSFMQYLCKAISTISVLLCTVQCRRCFKNETALNKICLNVKIYLFCHLPCDGFWSNSSLPSHLSHSKEHEMLFISCTPWWQFCVHPSQHIGSRNEKKHKNCQNSRLPTSRGEENAASTETDSLCT